MIRKPTTALLFFVTYIWAKVGLLLLISDGDGYGSIGFIIWAAVVVALMGAIALVYKYEKRIEENGFPPPLIPLIFLGFAITSAGVFLIYKGPSGSKYGWFVTLGEWLLFLLTLFLGFKILIICFRRIFRKAPRPFVLDTID